MDHSVAVVLAAAVTQVVAVADVVADTNSRF
jgi:hypothetical protein